MEIWRLATCGHELQRSTSVQENSYETKVDSKNKAMNAWPLIGSRVFYATADCAGGNPFPVPS